MPENRLEIIIINKKTTSILNILITLWFRIMACDYNPIYI